MILSHWIFTETSLAYSDGISFNIANGREIESALARSRWKDFSGILAI